MLLNANVEAWKDWDRFRRCKRLGQDEAMHVTAMASSLFSTPMNPRGGRARSYNQWTRQSAVPTLSVSL